MTSKSNHPLSQEEFNTIYGKVPRLTVEIIIQHNNSLYLTKRNIDPCKGMWHLPGGTVRFGEKLTEAVGRIAERELNIKVGDVKLLGYIEYPSHYLNGLDSPVGIAFLVNKYEGNIKLNSEAKDSGWFSKLPSNMHDEQITFIKQNSLLNS